MDTRRESDPEYRCPYCDGYGFVVADCTIDLDTGDYARSKCWYCEGTGDRYYTAG